MTFETVIRPEAVAACSRRKVQPTRYFLTVNISRQTTSLFKRSGRSFHWLKTYRCSTSKYGVGEAANSNMTPRGLHRIAEKIGEGCPAGTIFRSRQAAGFTWQADVPPMITTRIFWLEGLEPGLNRGGNVDSHARYIYVHGTGDEETLGRPASHGCVHLAAADLVPLYDLLPVGTLLWIVEK
jgi:hypothetical protein